MMDPSDLQLAQADLPAGALRVALALRCIGERATVERIMALTGLPRSTVYDARNHLRRRFGSQSEDSERPSEISEPPRSTAMRQYVAAGGPLPMDDRAPAWKSALNERAIELAGRRSWDAWADVYAPAWDTLARSTAQPGEFVALAVNYVETVDGFELTGDERALVARLIRSYGKAGLYGLHRACGVSDETPRDRYRYARRVAERTLADLRTDRGGHVP